MEETKCKFCGADTLFKISNGRVYNKDGVSFHTEVCEKSKEHYKNESLTMHEYKRSNRPRTAPDAPKGKIRKKRKPSSYERDLYDLEHGESFGLNGDDNSYNAGCRDDV
jgi:hypothetical protein